MKFDNINYWMQRLIRGWWVFVTIFDIWLLWHGKLMAVSAYSWLFLTSAVAFSFYMERAVKRTKAQAEQLRQSAEELKARMEDLARNIERTNSSIREADKKLSDIKWDRDG